MTLAAGTRLGPYEILSPLGAGGMGEVYRARDTRLGREVAVKVLPPEFKADRNRLARFEQEARAASALDHPNVVSVLDVGSEGETVYIAMTLVEGRSLRDAMGAGPMPVKKLLDAAAQIADGLAKAHATGIVHRDLKPENVMLSRDGFVKILDFGLAKLVRPENEGGSTLPTAAPSDTAPGVVMGTIEYMSPEQAGGGTVDFRSDQFSLGTIVYEMATGRKPFSRRTAAETLVAILREEPEPAGNVDPRLPVALRWIIERCLAKDPEERYGSTKDLARDLRAVQTHLSESGSTSGVAAAIAAPRRGMRVGTPRLAAALVAGVALGAAGYAVLASRTARKSTVPSFRRLTFQRGNILHARFAPDGQTIVYSAAWEDNPTEVFVSRIDGTESRPLGLTGADLTAVSAESGLLLIRKSRFVKTPAGMGTLASAPLEGGAARDIAENVHAGDWLGGGIVVALKHVGVGYDALEFPPGTRRLDGVNRPPRVSQDGERIAVAHAPANEVVVLDATGRTLWTAGSGGDFDSLAWHPNGEVWFSRSVGQDPGLFAVVRGKPPRAILRSTGWVLHDIAPDGRLLMERGILRTSLRVRLAAGSRERELSWLDGSELAGMSADGATVLLSETNEAGVRSGGVYSRRTDGSPAVRLADGSAMALSEDGRWALVQFFGEPRRFAFVPTGAGETRPLALSNDEPQSAVFLPGPDPRVVAVVGNAPDKASLEILTPAGRRRLGIAPRFSAALSRLTLVVSPDGGSVAWQSADREVTVCTLEKPACRTLKTGAGADPVQWSADGKYLYLSDMGEIPAHVTRYEIATGAEAPWLTLGPEDPTAFINIGQIVLSRDGRSYAYNAREVRDSGLFLVEGLK